MVATWVGVVDAVQLARAAEVAVTPEATAAVAAEVMEKGAEAEVAAQGAAEGAGARASTEVATVGAIEAEAKVMSAPGTLVRAGLEGWVEILQEM